MGGEGRTSVQVPSTWGCCLGGLADPVRAPTVVLQIPELRDGVRSAALRSVKSPPAGQANGLLRPSVVGRYVMKSTWLGEPSILVAAMTEREATSHAVTLYVLPSDPSLPM